MAKRSTIGENPLDAVSQEHPLDTVVPDLSARTGRGQPPPEVDPEVQARLAELEAGLKTLRAEMTGLKTAAAEAAALKGTIAGLPVRWPDCAGRSTNSRLRPRPPRPSRPKLSSSKLNWPSSGPAPAPATSPFGCGARRNRGPGANRLDSHPH